MHLYVGLKFDAELVREMKEAGRSVNLTPPVQDFMAFLERCEGCDHGSFMEWRARVQLTRLRVCNVQA